MKEIVCTQCAGREWIEQNGFRTCAFCGTKYRLTADDYAVLSSDISLNGDVQRLLQKCKEDPINARKYANLALDIDPGNAEALGYLYNRKGR